MMTFILQKELIYLNEENLCCKLSWTFLLWFAELNPLKTCSPYSE